MLFFLLFNLCKVLVLDEECTLFFTQFYAKLVKNILKVLYVKILQ